MLEGRGEPTAGLCDLAAAELGPYGSGDSRQRRRRAPGRDLRGTGCATGINKAPRLSVGRHVQLPDSGRYRGAEHAFLGRGYRHQCRLWGVLALAACRISERFTYGNHRHLRAARLHLGREVVALRHDTFRIPAGTAAEYFTLNGRAKRPPSASY